MALEPLSFKGWNNNLALRNGKVELIITLDVGPRILSYRALEGENVLKVYEEQTGTTGEGEWKIRGGHRLWVAPEGEISYALDNTAVSYKEIPNGVEIENPPVAPWGIRKVLSITLAEDSSEVTIGHKLINEKEEPITLAAWGLSVMAPGGIEIIPCPPLGEHPKDLLPQRVIVPWPYTDLSDPRYSWGRHFITLKQTPEGGPTKIGLAHREKWVGYLLGSSFFAKAFPYEEGEIYPDLGVNFETFTNQQMIEIESLSPLRTLQPGESVEYTERWALIHPAPQPSSLREEDLLRWVDELSATHADFAQLRR